MRNGENITAVSPTVIKHYNLLVCCRSQLCAQSDEFIFHRKIHSKSEINLSISIMFRYKKRREQELPCTYRKRWTLKQKMKYSMLALRFAVPSACLPIA